MYVCVCGCSSFFSGLGQLRRGEGEREGGGLSTTVFFYSEDEDEVMDEEKIKEKRRCLAVMVCLEC